MQERIAELLDLTNDFALVIEELADSFAELSQLAEAIVECTNALAALGVEDD